MKKEAPLFNEASLAKARIAFFSDNSEVTIEDFILNHFAVRKDEFINEPRELSRRRREIENAIATVQLLSKQGIPPIISAPIFQALQMKGL
jgi:hypothetical protein